MDTYSFIVYIKTDDIYKDIAEDVETRFDTSNYEKKCVIKRKLKFKNYKNCLEATQLDNIINYLEKNKLTWFLLLQKTT